MRAAGPQQTFLFRLVAFVTRFRIHQLHRRTERKQLALGFYVFASGTTALGIITLAAFAAKLPLLFPPLGPSAFILFRTPMSPAASPRSVIFSHALALAAGIGSLYVADLLFPDAHLYNPHVLNGPRVLAIALAMGVTSVGMIAGRFAHPPAAATALLGGMAYFSEFAQIGGLLAAVFLLVLQAWFFVRVLGGLPYPRWQADPKVSRHYGTLAGISEEGTSYWQQLVSQIHLRR